MSFFDLLNELRKSKPNLKKAIKAMKVLGWICFAGSVWNLLLPNLIPSGKFQFALPPVQQIGFLASLVAIGVLFMASARGLRRNAPWGIIAGQIAIAAMLIEITCIPLLMLNSNDGFFRDPIFMVFGGVAFSIAFFQFAIPGYFGIRYLGRLELKPVALSERTFGDDSKPADRVREADVDSVEAIEAAKYRDALLPLGVMGTFALMVSSLLIAVFAVQKYLGENAMAYVFLPGFALVFFGPMIFNRIPSPFQKDRQVIRSFTGGGSLFLFQGSWPFFRLLVYSDGLEVRVMLHRFFIPYDKMGGFPDKLGFFNLGLCIKSDLPGVPSNIRFKATGMNAILGVISDSRNNFKATRRTSVDVGIAD